MTKPTSLLAAAIVASIVGLGFATSSNAQSAKPVAMSDQDYCQALLKELRNYGWGTVRGNPVGVATAVAIAQCQEGEAKQAIPVLEKEMSAYDLHLPASVQTDR